MKLNLYDPPSWVLKAENLEIFWSKFTVFMNEVGKKLNTRLQTRLNKTQKYLFPRIQQRRRKFS